MHDPSPQRWWARSGTCSSSTHKFQGRPGLSLIKFFASIRFACRCATQFVVQNGNNHEVVRRVLKKRPWLVEAITAKQVCNIRWKPTSQGLKYDELNQNGRLMIVNHLEHHAEITQKAKLYQNVRQYCRVQSIYFFFRGGACRYRTDTETWPEKSGRVVARVASRFSSLLTNQ